MIVDIWNWLCRVSLGGVFAWWLTSFLQPIRRVWMFRALISYFFKNKIFINIRRFWTESRNLPDPKPQHVILVLSQTSLESATSKLRLGSLSIELTTLGSISYFYRVCNSKAYCLTCFSRLLLSDVTFVNSSPLNWAADHRVIF